MPGTTRILPTSTNPDSTPLRIEDITDPITGGILIEPVKLNCCNQAIERVALALQLRRNNSCPFCRRPVTEAPPDLELAQKIQDQFVKLSEENKKIFDEQKRFLETDSLYSSVREQPTMPTEPVYRRPPPDETSLEDIMYAAGYAPADVLFDDHPPIRESLHEQFRSQMRSGNLDQAEQTAGRIDNTNTKNLYYNEIAKIYLEKAKQDAAAIPHLQNATRVTCKMSENCSLKNDLLTEIAIHYAAIGRPSNAFQTIKKMKGFIFKFLNTIVVCFFITLRGVFWPVRAIKKMLRS